MENKNNEVTYMVTVKKVDMHCSQDVVLTGFESKIIEHLIQGLSQKEIAYELQVSRQLVSRQLKECCSKNNCNIYQLISRHMFNLSTK